MNRPDLHRVDVIQKLSDKRLTECEAVALVL
jgi:predicted nucleic acid-binding Zn ribbon protein